MKRLVIRLTAFFSPSRMSGRDAANRRTIVSFVLYGSDVTVIRNEENEELWPEATSPPKKKKKPTRLFNYDRIRVLLFFPQR